MIAIIAHKVVSLLCNIIVVDNCVESNDGCTQTCTNTTGSFSCFCGPGYILTGDRHSCTDIDECTEDIDGCNQTCVNTVGSYTCSCYSGYHLENDEQICNSESLYAMGPSIYC